MVKLSTREEIRKELNRSLPNDRVGGVLTLEQEKWLFDTVDIYTNILKRIERQTSVTVLVQQALKRDSQ